MKHPFVILIKYRKILNQVDVMIQTHLCESIVLFAFFACKSIPIYIRYFTVFITKPTIHRHWEPFSMISLEKNFEIKFINQFFNLRL